MVHLPIESGFFHGLFGAHGHMFGSCSAEGGAFCKMPQHGELRVDSIILFQQTVLLYNYMYTKIQLNNHIDLIIYMFKIVYIYIYVLMYFLDSTESQMQIRFHPYLEELRAMFPLTPSVNSGATCHSVHFTHILHGLGC